MKKNIKYQISLSRKFVLCSLVASSVMLFYLFYLFIKERSIQNNQAALSISAELSFTKKVFDDSAKYTDLVLNGIVDKVSQNPQDKVYIGNILKSFRMLHDSKMKDILSISMFSWVDANDKLVVSSEFGVLKNSADLSGRDYLQLTKYSPNKLYFGKPVIGGVSGQYIIPSGIGLFDGDGVYKGSVVVGFNIENIYQQFLKGKILDGSNFQIIYKKEFGVIKNSISINKRYLEKIDLENPNIQTLKESSIFGQSPVLVYQKIANSPYGILISFDNPNQVNVVKESYLLEFILIVVFFGILIYLLRRNFIDPIIILSQQADLVGCGKDDIEIPESNILEINQLSKSIISIQHFIKTEQDLKSQLDVANQKLHSLLKSISHDLRNYISGISGLAEIIAEKKELTKENIQQDQQYAQMIIKQSKLILGFAKDVLNTENLGIIKLDESQDCDIKELIEEMLILNQHFVRDQQVKIITKFQKNLPPLKCDGRRFRQVIDNLITNAVKYSKKGGEVEVSCQLSVVSDRENKEKRQIQIIIKDNGIGMTQEDIKAVLAGKGKDVDKSDLDKPIDSHGIGMSIVVQVVEALGARMEIESEKKKGTTVKLWFNMGDDNADNNFMSAIENDVVDDLQALPAQKKQAKTKSLKNPKTIIIADDEEINLMLLERVLSGTNHKIIKAKNGREVLEILDQQKCDLIFMDIRMPELDGLKTAKAIRGGKNLKNKKYQLMPIIGISGNDDDESKKKALKAGMDFMVGKPLDKIKVLGLVKKFLG